MSHKNEHTDLSFHHSILNSCEVQCRTEMLESQGSLLARDWPCRLELRHLVLDVLDVESILTERVSEKEAVSALNRSRAPASHRRLCSPPDHPDTAEG